MVQPIVEGHGEVSAVPVLLRRLLGEAQQFSESVGHPIRRRRWEFGSESAVRKAVRLALYQPGCSAILIIFDADDDCPRDHAPHVWQWATAEARGIPVAVVMPKREYEAWFLASIESLRGRRGIREDAEPHATPEAPRDAKGALRERMTRGEHYLETADQAALTGLMDFRLTFQRCRSFRRLVSALGQILPCLTTPDSHWPPAAWAEQN